MHGGESGSTPVSATVSVRQWESICLVPHVRYLDRNFIADDVLAEGAAINVSVRLAATGEHNNHQN